ncbi:MAG: hypothetical protein JWO72_324 [Caulobacteraceae bacterium]|jgi:hypothetical protein|nr:hypothetical protein [Caulobacteraceae bacterium]
MKPIPGTFAALSILACVGLVMAAAFVGGLWLLAEGAAWVGHELPRPIL